MILTLCDSISYHRFIPPVGSNPPIDHRVSQRQARSISKQPPFLNRETAVFCCPSCKAISRLISFTDRNSSGVCLARIIPWASVKERHKNLGRARLHLPKENSAEEFFRADAILSFTMNSLNRVFSLLTPVRRKDVEDVVTRSKPLAVGGWTGPKAQDIKPTASQRRKIGVSNAI